MIIRKIFDVGGSRCISLPKQLCDAIGFDVGSYFKIEYDEKIKKITLAPVK